MIKEKKKTSTNKDGRLSNENVSTKKIDYISNTIVTSIDKTNVSHAYIHST